jgi:N-acetylglutamate synthase-like GNAT family acetyltransferase
VSELRVEPLARSHNTQAFTSDVPELDRWLQRFALIAEAAGTARTYVLTVLVHASDERAASFYEHFGFIRSPSDPLHLTVLMKDLRKAFRRVAR